MTIKEEVDCLASYGIQIRRQIHQNPELGDQEFETTKLIKEELSKMGATILDRGLTTGVLAEIRGEHPGITIAVRADIDALPVKENTNLPFQSTREGISHSCGHDMHTAAALLAAKVLSNHTSELHGNVRFMFQPAEECSTGALTMLSHGALEDPKPSYAIAVHTWPDTPAGMISVKPGSSHASSDTIIIKVTGKGGHGAHPYRCVDPIIACAYMLTQMQTIIARELPMTEGGVLTFGSIHGGTASNVIPNEVEVQGTLRTTNPAWRKQIQESIIRIATSSCAAMRAEAEVSIIDGMPPVVNDLSVIDGIRQAAATVLGADHVKELPACSPGSDDFAFYQEQVPGALFRMGTGTEDPDSHIGLHNGRNIFGEEGIPTAAATIVQFMLDKLQ